MQQITCTLDVIHFLLNFTTEAQIIIKLILMPQKLFLWSNAKPVKHKNLFLK